MQKSSFFNAIVENGVPDRTYLAEDFASYFASFIGNGVFPLPSTCLQVIANGDMTVTVKAGSAWINGYYYINTDDLTFTLTVADGVLKRIDRLVVRCDFAEREISIIVKQGEYSNSPIAKNLQRDADAYELGIADIAITNGAISITQSSITDLRLNNAYCGYVTGVIEQVDTTTIFNQFSTWYAEFTNNFTAQANTWKSQYQTTAEEWKEDFENNAEDWMTGEEQAFNVWLENLKTILDENVAANLQNQINDIKENGVSKAQTSENCTGNAATATKLETARKINGTAFDGSKDITIEDSTKMPLTGGTFTGKAYAQTNTDYSTLQLRNISASTSAVTTLANGAIHLVYEA